MSGLATETSSRKTGWKGRREQGGLCGGNGESYLRGEFKEEASVSLSSAGVNRKTWREGAGKKVMNGQLDQSAGSPEEAGWEGALVKVRLREEAAANRGGS